VRCRYGYRCRGAGTSLARTRARLLTCAGWSGQTWCVIPTRSHVPHGRLLVAPTVIYNRESLLWPSGECLRRSHLIGDAVDTSRVAQDCGVGQDGGAPLYTLLPQRSRAAFALRSRRERRRGNAHPTIDGVRHERHEPPPASSAGCRHSSRRGARVVTSRYGGWARRCWVCRMLGLAATGAFFAKVSRCCRTAKISGIRGRDIDETRREIFQRHDGCTAAAPPPAWRPMACPRRRCPAATATSACTATAQRQEPTDWLWGIHSVSHN
jgi:hypothetical protein